MAPTLDVLVLLVLLIGDGNGSLVTSTHVRLRDGYLHGAEDYI